MQVTWLDTLIWIADAAMACIALAALLMRRLGPRWKFLALFLSVRIASELAQAIAVHGRYRTYFYTYWISSSIQYLIQFGILYEVAASVLSSFPNIPKSFSRGLAAASLAAAIISVAISMRTETVFNAKMLAAFVGMQRTALMAWCAAFVACSIATSRIGLAWKHNPLVIASGAAVMNSSGMLASFIHGALGLKHSALIDNLAGVVDISVLLFLSVFLRAESISARNSHPPPAAMTDLEEFAQTTLGVEIHELV